MLLRLRHTVACVRCLFLPTKSHSLAWLSLNLSTHSPADGYLSGLLPDIFFLICLHYVLVFLLVAIDQTPFSGTKVYLPCREIYLIIPKYLGETSDSGFAYKITVIEDPYCVEYSNSCPRKEWR